MSKQYDFSKFAKDATSPDKQKYEFHNDPLMVKQRFHRGEMNRYKP